MPGSFCYICHRPLSDPLSVKLGIGPVCRAKEYQQEVFDFMRAKIETIKHERGKYIFIRDIGRRIGRSVTNDAEFVIGQLYLDFGIDDETRIFYEDSGGVTDELLHSSNKFRGFRAGHEWVEL